MKSEKEPHEIISAYIKTIGIKQLKLAEAIGVSDTTITLYLRGERKLSEENEKKLLKFLNLG
jgi:transcriptional regulator with XRE-family HTH domain